jgi:hypothetical protein
MNNEFTFLLAGAIVLVWLYWLPRVLVPFLAPHYHKLPKKTKAFLALLLPTLEMALLNYWEMIYKGLIQPTYEKTETELDDKAWLEIDKRVREALEKIDPEEK